MMMVSVLAYTYFVFNFILVDCLPLLGMCDEDDECCSESCIDNTCVSFETGAMEDDDG